MIIKNVFIFVSKCAGTSMNYALKDYENVVRCAPNRGEYWLHGHKRRVLDFDSSSFSFGFVRNPFDRMVSAWKHFSRDQSPYRVPKDFLGFLDYMDNEHLGAGSRRASGGDDNGQPWKIANDFVKSHTWSYLDERQKLFYGCGCQRVSFIGRFERIQEDFDYICSKIGLPENKRKLPHMNAQKHKNYREYYNEETIGIVSERYKKDLEHFDYKF